MLKDEIQKIIKIIESKTRSKTSYIQGRIFEYFADYLLKVITRSCKLSTNSVVILKSQSKILSCSHKLVDSGVILQIFNRVKYMLLNDIVEEFKKYDCKHFDAYFQNAKDHMTNECEDLTEFQLFSTLEESIDKSKCMNL